MTQDPMPLAEALAWAEEAVAEMFDDHGRNTQGGQFCRETDRLMRTCRCGDLAAAIRARGTA